MPEVNIFPERFLASCFAMYKAPNMKLRGEIIAFEVSLERQIQSCLNLSTTLSVFSNFSQCTFLLFYASRTL